MENINKNSLVDTYISNIELSIEIDTLKNKYNNLENNLVALQNMISDTLEEEDN